MKFILTLVLAMSAQVLLAQHLPGISTGTYSGVNGVFANPANVVDSRYKWDVNLLGFNIGVGNDQASFNLNKLSDLAGDSLRNIFIGKNGESTNALLNLAVHTPSFMLQVGKKNGVAFTSRARVLFNAHDLDGELANRLLEGNENIDDLPYSIGSAQNMIVNANVWAEAGLSYGRIVFDEGPHFVKAGITGKYLAGVGNTHLQLGKVQATLDYDDVQEDAYLKDATGRVSIGVGGINVADFDAANLTKFESSGFGADIGVVYEYRPGSGDDKASNAYKFRVGLSITDIGSIKYKKDPTSTGGYDLSVTGTERLYLSEFDDVSMDDINQKLESMPQFFTPIGDASSPTYSVSLPTAMHALVDYNILRGLYVGLQGTVSMVNVSSKPYNSQYYSSISLTPRYETSWLGVYLPLQHNALTGTNIGAALRLGPLYVGSGSILSALTQESKQVDVFFGIRFGMTKK